MSGRKTGTVKWFDRRKGYGFIETEGSPDMFVHQSEIQIDGFRALYPDQQVEFTSVESGPQKRLCATQVSAVGGAPLESGSKRGRSRRTRGSNVPAPAASGDDAADATAAPAKAKGEGKKRNRTRRPRLTNLAFVFIKPHAVTDAVKVLVKDTLEQKGLRVLTEGTLTAEEIDEKKLIDQHYYAIASKATILKPAQLAVPADKFKETFGEDWQACLSANKVFNAMDGCKELGVDADKLNELWAACKKAKKLVKFGGGFYCGKVEHAGKSIYCFNGFFMSMRAKFTTPGTSIYYYVVEWAPSKLPWADFRGKVLGPTDPTEAPADSLRGVILGRWKELGLKAEPDVGDNGVHASASPFEALAERMNWLGVEPENDHYGKALLAAGVDDETIGDWSRDPRVKMPSGEDSSLFDALEDMDARDCMHKCAEILGKPVTK